MLDQITAALEPGEELLWSGRPEKFEAKDKTYAARFRTALIIKCIVTAALLFVSIYSGIKAGAVKPILLIFILAVGGYAILTPYFNVRTLKKKVCYAVTDKRIIVLNESVQSVKYDTVEKAVFKTDADGHVTLLIGPEAIKTKPGAWRSNTTISPIYDTETGKCDRMTLYAIPESRKVKELISQYIRVE